MSEYNTVRFILAFDKFVKLYRKLNSGSTPGNFYVSEYFFTPAGENWNEENYSGWQKLVNTYWQAWIVSPAVTE